MFHLLHMKNYWKIKKSAKTNKIQLFRMATENAFEKCSLPHTKWFKALRSSNFQQKKLHVQK